MKRKKYQNKSREELIEDNKDLEKFHHRYIRIMENARDMIYRMSLPDGKYEYISPASKEIFGYEPKALLDNPVLIQKAIHPDFIQYFKDEWQKLLNGDLSPIYEYKIIHKSGDERWLNQRNVLVKNDEGKPIAIEGIVTDITKQKEAELERDILIHDLGERAKELYCLYKISDYAYEEKTVDAFIKKVVEIIPPSFQYSEYCSAKIKWQSKEYKSKRYKKSNWEIQHEIKINNEKVGDIVINYLKKLPKHDHGPFLKEELDLINGIAELVSRTIDSKQKDIELKEKNNEYLAINEELKEKNEEFLAVNEELQEKNEEYQALNEEYLSQNEELQERNEEFQAINEELEEEMEKRVEVQKILKSQHDSYLTIFDNHPDVMYIVDPQTYEVLFVNENFRKMLGADPVGHKCYEKFQGFDKPCEFCTNDILKKSPKEPYIWEFYNPLLKKDFLITDKLIKWPDGRNVRFELAIDITERKKAQSELEISEKRFRNLFEYSPLGKSMTGVDGSLSVNKAFCDILGYTEKELQTKNWKEITHPDDIQESIDIVQALLNGEMESAHYEKRYIHKEGHIVIADVNTSLLRDTDNKPQYFITTISDITQRKEMQFKLEKMLKELERSNKELEQFAYVASHDLQEPLRKVKNFAELFAKKYSGALDEKADQYIKYMTSGADRMQNLILDLLSFSRVATRGKEFVKTGLDDIVKKVEENLQLTIEETNAKIVYNDLPIVRVDESQITQVFQNLISNAIKFKSDKKPIIKIEAKNKKNNWQISVTDNGIGMHMKYKERIFEVFQRLHTKEEYKGTGIGLAICKKIIERHQGKIWIDSKPGEGSTFYFTLPKN